MKKLLTFLFVGLLGFMLIACQPTPPAEEDTVKPVIAGANDITINVGDTFDPLAGVTATDDVDGPIVLTAANVTGTVNVNAAGTYELTYTVEDEAGNEATKKRIVTVVAPVMGNLINGDFANGLDGYVTWFDQTTGYNATYNVVAGVLEIDITELPAADTQWWAVQLQWNATNLEAFTSYTLEFDVKADDARYMNYQIQGGTPAVIGGDGATGKAFGENNFTAITTDWVTISKDFYVRNDVTGAQLQFSFGNFAENTGVPAEFRVVETKIYIDNIKLVPGPELEPQAPTFSVTNQVIKVGQPFTFGTGVSIADDKDTIVWADVTWTQSSGPETFDPADPAVGVYVFDLEVEDSDELSSEATYTITVAVPWNRPQSFEIFGNPQNWDNTFDGFYLREVDGNWFDYTYEAGELAVDITAVADGDYQAALVMNKIQFFAGTYTITFEAKADVARKLRVAIEGAGLEDAWRHIDLTTDWVEITLTYEFETDQFNKELQFWFGSLTTVRPPYTDAQGANPSPFVPADDVLTTVYFRNLEVIYSAE